MARGSAGTGSGSGGGTAGVTSVNTRTGAVTLAKTDVALDQVDNTADTAKPVSTAQQTALNAKAPIASPTFTGTVAGVTAAMVGLPNVNNTADTAKPVSTAQQSALDLKAPLASPTFTGTVSGVSAAAVGLGNVNNTADSAKPVSTAQAAAIALVRTTVMQPPIGYSVQPALISGASTGAPTYQTQQIVPIDVGPTGWTADALVVQLTTAYTGATIPTAFGGVYATDPSTGYPDTSQLLGSGSLDLTGVTAGIRVIPFSAAVALPAGRYWLTFLLAGPAVTTAGAFTTISVNGYGFPIASSGTPGTSLRALVAGTGLTALKTTSTTPNAFTLAGGTTNVMPYLRRSA